MWTVRIAVGKCKRKHITYLDTSWVPRLTKMIFSTEASCPSNVCRDKTQKSSESTSWTSVWTECKCLLSAIKIQYGFSQQSQHKIKMFLIHVPGLHWFISACYTKKNKTFTFNKKKKNNNNKALLLFVTITISSTHFTIKLDTVKSHLHILLETREIVEI